MKYRFLLDVWECIYSRDHSYDTQSDTYISTRRLTFECGRPDADDAVLLINGAKYQRQFTIHFRVGEPITHDPPLNLKELRNEENVHRTMGLLSHCCKYVTSDGEVIDTSIEAHVISDFDSYRLEIVLKAALCRGKT